MNLSIRPALKDEIDWINHCYDDIHFVRSQFDREFIAVAEINGEKAGLGRLVNIDSKTQELGGMYVFDEFRQRGLARQIIQFLINNAKDKTVYCIPFTHLLKLYQDFGFKPCEDLKNVPQEVLDKFKGCQDCYKHHVALLVLT